MKHFSVPIAKLQLFSILAKFLRGYLVAPPGDPGSNPAAGEIFFSNFFSPKMTRKHTKYVKTRPSRVYPSLVMLILSYSLISFLRRSRNVFYVSHQMAPLCYLVKKTKKCEKMFQKKIIFFGGQPDSNPGRPRDSLSDLSKSAVFCSYLFYSLTPIRSEYIFATALMCLLK